MWIGLGDVWESKEMLGTALTLAVGGPDLAFQQMARSQRAKRGTINIRLYWGPHPFPF